jgi:hypothetical protein
MGYTDFCEKNFSSRFSGNSAAGRGIAVAAMWMCRIAHGGKLNLASAFPQ